MSHPNQPPQFPSDGQAPIPGQPYAYQAPQQFYPNQPYPYQSAPQAGPYSQQWHQPAYGGYSYPQQWAPPGAYGSSHLVRPGFVIAAAAIGFVLAAFTTLSSVVMLLILAVMSDQSEAAPLYGIAVLSLVMAVLLVWGGVVALTGKTNVVLLIGAASGVLLAFFNAVIAEGPYGIVGAILPILIIVFLMLEPSRAWFRAKG